MTMIKPRLYHMPTFQHTAPAKVAFVEFESLNENMDVSRCFITKTDGGYSQEECELESQSQTYKLPVISEDLDDLVELTIPEPHKTCQLFKYEVPEITCQVRMSTSNLG